jgi:hypothetical protein
VIACCFELSGQPFSRALRLPEPRHLPSSPGHPGGVRSFDRDYWSINRAGNVSSFIELVNRKNAAAPVTG